MKMGCCFSCKEDDSDLGDSNERTQLLRDPVSSNIQDSRLPQRESERLSGSTDNAHGRGQEDELAKILQETAAAMIDVSGSGSHSLDQREFQERSRHYLQKVQGLNPALIKPNTTNNLLGDVPNPEKHISAPLISQDDLDLVDWAMDEITSALHSIKVEHDEDLVVPFGQTAIVGPSD